MIERLQSIALTASEIITNRPSFSIEEKYGHANFVTDIDKRVQDAIVSGLTDLLPGSCIIAEEQDNGKLSDLPTWIIDPIDGTTNFIHDYRQSCVSIALLKNREPIIGLVYQPYSQEMFIAEKGKGTTLNGHHVHVSANDYSHALVSIGTSPYNTELAEKSLKLALKYLHECSDIRRSGSAAIDLANVACGRSDFFFEMTLKPWDFAAGALLISEAGGRFITPFCDSEADFSAPHAVFASNLICFDTAFSRFLEYAQGLPV